MRYWKYKDEMLENDGMKEFCFMQEKPTEWTRYDSMNLFDFVRQKKRQTNRCCCVGCCFGVKVYV